MSTFGRLAFCLGCAGPVLASGNSRPTPPRHLTALAGDRSVVLHWDRSPDQGVLGYHLYRAVSPEGRFRPLNDAPLGLTGYADLQVANGRTYTYHLRAVSAAGPSADSATATATPAPFASDAAFLEYLQHAAFDYFWYEANPTNGLIRDRSEPGSFCSIAAVGFGLTALGIGIDHGWIPRGAGRTRALAALRTFWDQPQGADRAGVIGYRGWFYHFLDLTTAQRWGTVELSSIDTALLLAGVLDARQYFDGADARERQIRSLATAIYDRVDWKWMADGGSTFRMGWRPESGFLSSRWVGYNEAMILYLLGLGATHQVAPAIRWSAWTRGYQWQTNDGFAYVSFPPLFGHQYAQCWIYFRHLADPYLRGRGLTYFENSRRATLAQRAYAIANPMRHLGYGPNVWGLTACDGPGTAPYLGYAARGAPPALNDDGTLAPTAPGGSLPFAPEVCLPALRTLYDRFRTRLWCEYGFRDAFNLSAGWWDPDVIGIDQGPILIMAENYRSQSVWRRFMRCPEVRRGLQAAGFGNWLSSRTGAPPHSASGPAGDARSAPRHR